MIVYNTLASVDLSGDWIAVLGNFDGVHKGHQQLIEEAKKLGGKILLITFHPHPLVFKGVPLKTIQSLTEKLASLEYYGVDGVLIVPFTNELAMMDKEAFVRDILVRALGIKGVVVGYNYHFGRNGEGKSSDIVDYGRNYGYNGIVVPAFRLHDHVVSSSLIRQFLLSGKIREANELMGHGYTVEGRVVRGQGVGKTLGFPTANLETAEDKLLPKLGVYSILGQVRGNEYSGFCNIGTQPTFKEREKKLVVEAHFFDFNEDIYDEKVSIRFVDYLRPVKRFSSVESLVEELVVDKKSALKSIEKNGHLDLH